MRIFVFALCFSLLTVLSVITIPSKVGLAQYNDPLFVSGKQYWQQRNYLYAFRALRQFRKQSFGRSADVDFMLGVSACQISSERDWGAKLLNWMQYAYPLSAGGRNWVRENQLLCVQARPPALPPLTVALLPIFGSAGMSGRGKLYYWVNRAGQFLSYPPKLVRQIPLEELSARLRSVGNSSAEQSVIRRVGNDFTTISHNNFILASNVGHSLTLLNRWAAVADSFAHFLSRRYDVTMPNNYITVYLVSSIEDLREFAEDHHGLDVSSTTIGYAFRDDMSVVAVAQTGFGTVLHELFHLLVRQNFGDIPLWLDEGMAALYEVAEVEANGNFVGLPNWRGRVLRSLWDSRVPLRELVASDWSFLSARYEEFGSNPEIEDNYTRKEAAFLAEARYFILYLQSQGILTQVFSEIRDNGLGKMTIASGADPGDSIVKLLEDLLGKPMRQVDLEFSAWFNSY